MALSITYLLGEGGVVGDVVVVPFGLPQPHPLVIVFMFFERLSYVIYNKYYV